MTFAEHYSVSIAAVYALRNVPIGLRTAGRFTFWLFALVKLSPFEHGNRPRDIRPMVATIAADRLQQQKRKHMFFKETARPGSIGLLSPTFPAVKFLEKLAPRGSGKGSHKISPGQDHSNPV
jgi:hypothetical protein